MKLSQKLLLAVLPVLGLVLSLGGWLLIRQDFTASLAAMQRQAETEQLRERSALQAELLSADVDPVLYLPEYGAAVEKAVREAGIPEWVTVKLGASSALVPEGQELPDVFDRSVTPSVKFTKPRTAKEA